MRYRANRGRAASSERDVTHAVRSAQMGKGAPAIHHSPWWVMTCPFDDWNTAKFGPGRRQYHYTGERNTILGCGRETHLTSHRRTNTVRTGWIKNNHGNTTG